MSFILFYSPNLYAAVKPIPKRINPINNCGIEKAKPSAPVNIVIIDAIIKPITPK